MIALLALVCGGMVLAGVFLMVFGLIPADVVDKTPRPVRKRRTIERDTWLRAGGSVVVGMAVWAIFGWLLGGIVAAVMTAVVPSLIGAAKAPKQAITRAGALQQWTHGLSGVLGNGVGLTQALTASLRTTPRAIRTEVQDLVARLDAGWRAKDALRAFGDDLNDSNGDLVVAALTLASTRTGADLASVLEGLALTTAEEVSIAEKIEAEREEPRSVARIITIITLAVLALAPLWKTWRTGYGTPIGGIALVILISAYLGCLLWMQRISAPQPEPRFLFDDTTKRVGR